MKLAIRGFVHDVRQFEDRIECDLNDLDNLLPELAKKHADALAAHSLHMIEIEFLDEPNPQERFFRFGTDPSGMVLPLAIDMENL